MSNTKHTPGPWAITGLESRTRDYQIGGSKGYLVAKAIRQSMDTQTEREANANLIAAAPNMLAELLRTQDELASIIRDTNLKNLGHIEKEMLTRWFNGVTATIHKAKGK